MDHHSVRFNPLPLLLQSLARYSTPVPTKQCIGDLPQAGQTHRKCLIAPLSDPVTCRRWAVTRRGQPENGKGSHPWLPSPPQPLPRSRNLVTSCDLMINPVPERRAPLGAPDCAAAQSGDLLPIKPHDPSLCHAVSESVAHLCKNEIGSRGVWHDARP